MKKIIDISYYQPTERIDYDRLLANVDGVLLRLGYGTGKYGDWANQPDPDFDQHYKEISERGVPLGCYHYMVQYKSVDDQLNIVVKPALYGKEFKLGFWPDVELEGGAPPLTRPTVIEYITKYEEHYGEQVEGIYTGAWCWNPIMGNKNPYSDRKLWVAGYGSAPILPYGWDEWFLWQYTSSGRLDGYTGNLDMNSISDENWSAWVGDYEPPVPVPDEVLFRAKFTKTALNVRSTPVYYSDNRNVVDRVSGGEIVDVYKINDANGWYQIGTNKWVSGYEGYWEIIETEPPKSLTLEQRVERIEKHLGIS